MSYGDSAYGTLSFGEVTSGQEDIKGYMPDLMEYLPEYYQNNREMAGVQGATGKQIGYVKYAIKDLMEQLFINTATWGLGLWENELNIKTDNTKTYLSRREIILAKLRGRGTTTIEMIKSVAEAFSGGEVNVTEYPGEYRFVVQFVGIMGIPQNMSGLIQTIEDIKPAHLAHGFKYTYTWWNTLKNLTWMQASEKTWAELRIYEGE